MNSRSTQTHAPTVVKGRPANAGRATTTYQVPIEGRDDWLMAAEVQSA